MWSVVWVVYFLANKYICTILWEYFLLLKIVNMIIVNMITLYMTCTHHKFYSAFLKQGIYDHNFVNNLTGLNCKSYFIFHVTCCILSYKLLTLRIFILTALLHTWLRKMSYKEFYIHPLIGNIPFSLIYFSFFFFALVSWSLLWHEQNKWSCNFFNEINVVFWMLSRI